MSAGSTGCPKGEHVHRDGTRWPSGASCGGDPRSADRVGPRLDDDTVRACVREHDPRNGPPFCRTCSEEAQAWVKWPCRASLLRRELAEAREVIRTYEGIVKRFRSQWIPGPGGRWHYDHDLNHHGARISSQPMSPAERALLEATDE